MVDKDRFKLSYFLQAGPYLLLTNTQQPITTRIGMIIVKFHTPTKTSNNNLITKAVIPRLKIKYSIRLSL